MISNRYKRLLIVCAIVPAVLVAVIGWFVRASEKDLVSSLQWVSHTFTVLDHVQSLDLALDDAESFQRGFLLTTNEAYLDSYRNAITNIPTHFAELQRLTVDNPKQQTALTRLNPLIHERLNALTNGIATARRGDLQKAIASVQAEPDKAASDAIDRELIAMKHEEYRLLASRDVELADRFRAHSRFTWTLLGLSILFGGGILYLLYRVATSQAILTVCAWSKAIQYEGKWLSFEQYMRERFGVEISHGMSPSAAEQFRTELDTMADDAQDQPK